MPVEFDTIQGVQMQEEIHRCADPGRQFRRKSYTGEQMLYLLVGVVSCILSTIASAQQEISPQVVVVVVSTGSGEDHLNFAYQGAVPEQEARARFERILREGKWQGRLLRVRTESLRSQTGELLPPITDVVGRARQVVDRRSGGLPVEPFLRAFADLDYFEIYFIVPGEMSFQGLRQWNTPHLQIQLIHSPGTYRYQIRILRRDGEVDLRVPFLQPVQEQSAPSNHSQRSRRGWQIAGWALVSFGIGGIAYLVMYWATRRPFAKHHETTGEG